MSKVATRTVQLKLGEVEVEALRHIENLLDPASGTRSSVLRCIVEYMLTLLSEAGDGFRELSERLAQLKLVGVVGDGIAVSTTLKLSIKMFAELSGWFVKLNGKSDGRPSSEVSFMLRLFIYCGLRSLLREPREEVVEMFRQHFERERADGFVRGRPHSGIVGAGRARVV